MFFDFYVTLWGIISPNKLILVKIRLEKVDLGEVYIQKEQENFKKCSSSNTIGGPLHMSHPVEAEQFDGKKVELCSTLATKGTYDKLPKIVQPNDTS